MTDSSPNQRGCASGVASFRRWLAGACLVGIANACSADRATEPAPRFFAVHNALHALGLHQVGTIHRGQLREGQATDLRVAFDATCVTVVAFGASSAKELTVELGRPGEKGVALERSNGAEAVLHACLERPGDYDVRLRMVHGSGEYLVSTWAGQSESPSAPQVAIQPGPGGTCEAPGVLVPGQTYSGTTEDGEDEHQGSCGNVDGRESVYKLELAQRRRLKIDVSAQFDSVLYVRKEDCLNESAEIECNDDAPGGVRRSQVEGVFDPGTYYVFVDGYGEESGRYRIRVTAQDVPTLSQICRDAPPLAASAQVVGRLAEAFDNAHASCGRQARGGDLAYRLELPTRARVRLTEKSSEFRPILHVRKSCEDEATELGCAEPGQADDEATWAGRLDAGSYVVFADSAESGATGTFHIGAEAIPEPVPAGSPGDACGDAIPVSVVAGRIEGDTFAARDDVTSSCVPPGASDMVYRFDLPRRARIHAQLEGDEPSHMLALLRSCAGPGAEVACASAVHEAVDPGSYFLVVDGARPDTFGRFAIRYQVRDVTGVEVACSHAPMLGFGQSVRGTLSASTDNFETSCGRAAVHGQLAPDRVYRFAVPKKTTIRLSLRTQGFPGVLALRKACADDATDLRCLESGESPSSIDVERELDAGTYYAVVEGAGSHPEGAFTLSLSRPPLKAAKKLGVR